MTEIRLLIKGKERETYTIHYSDGSTSLFTVKNGKDGENGKDGNSPSIEEIYEAYKTSTGENMIALWAQHLLKLQELDLEIRNLKLRLTMIPKEIEKLQKQIAVIEGKVTAAKKHEVFFLITLTALLYILIACITSAFDKADIKWIVKIIKKDSKTPAKG